MLWCSENGQTFRSSVSDGLLSPIKASIAWLKSVAGGGGGQAPQPERGALQRAGLTLVSASNTFSCQRETLRPQHVRSIEKTLDRDHGIYRALGGGWEIAE